MPWERMEDVPESLRGIEPPITLEQANEIAAIAEAVGGDWAIAIAQWKKNHEVIDGEWARREADMEELTAETPLSDLTAEQIRTIVAEVIQQHWLREGSLEAEAEEIHAAFRKKYCTAGDNRYWPQEVFMADPDFGNALLVTEEGRYFMVPFLQENDEVTFAPRAEWIEVERVYRRKEAEREEGTEEQEREIPAEELEDAEEGDFAGKHRSFPILKPEDVAAAAASIGRAGEDNYSTETLKQNIIKIAKRKGPAFVAQLPKAWREEEEEEEVQEAEVIFLAEAGEPFEFTTDTQIIEVLDGSENRRGPVSVIIEPIAPGWGNRKDRHYYPAQLLKEKADVFVGSRMFLTDHKQGERNVRNFASVIKEHVGFSPQGAPRYTMQVLNPDAAELVRNCAEAQALDQLHFSIFAKGTHRKARVDGQEGYVVTEIASDPKPYIDWVSAAGAGGRAVALAEAEVMEKQDVQAILMEQGAKGPLLTRLLERDYHSREEVVDALLTEREYVRRITGSGRPRMGEVPQRQQETVTPEEHERRLRKIEERYGLMPARAVLLAEDTK